MKKRNIINAIFFLIIFIVILLTTIKQPLNNLDELWNYNISRNIANGLVPYKDISMITSPLLHMITAFFLKVICNELIITRLLTAILATLILYFLYKITEYLKIEKIISYVVIITLLFTLNNYFRLDYNWFVAFIAILITKLELKNIEDKKKKLKHEFLIGLLVGGSICIKQTIGIILAIVSLIYCLLFIKDKKCFFIRIISMLIPILIIFIYLFINNAIYDYIDYCILGINTFSNSIPYIKLLKCDNWYLKILSILIPIIDFIVGLKIIINFNKGKDSKTLFTLFMYSMALFAITFPISNDEHFFIGILINVVLITYIIDLIIKKYLKDSLNKYLEIAIHLSLIVILIITIKNFNIKPEEYRDLKYFKYIPISDNIYELISSMDEYILNQDKKVYILDVDAVIYMIPIDRYNKDYDMFNLGNFGSRGQEGKIEDLKKEKDILLLIRNDEYPRNWQSPEVVREYVKENLEWIDCIYIYDVYEKE